MLLKLVEHKDEDGDGDGDGHIFIYLDLIEGFSYYYYHYQYFCLLSSSLTEGTHSYSFLNLFWLDTLYFFPQATN